MLERSSVASEITETGSCRKLKEKLQIAENLKQMKHLKFKQQTQ